MTGTNALEPNFFYTKELCHSACGGEGLVSILNHEELSALSHSEDEGKSLKEIAQALACKHPQMWIESEQNAASPKSLEF